MKNFKSDPTNQLIIAFLILLGMLLLFSCNPVKRVIKNKDFFAQVTEEVIKRGICSNDTIIVSKSDTTITIDSLITINIDSVIHRDDTVYFYANKIYNYKEKVFIRDTIKQIVKDNSLIDVLSKVSKNQKQEIVKLKADKNNLKVKIVGAFLSLFFAMIGLYFAIKYRK
jgi:hypothetical protein